MTTRQEAASGARSVEAQEHATSGLTQPTDPALQDHAAADALGENPAETKLGEMTLSAIQQGQSIHVRAGSPYNSADLFEGVYDSLEDAHYELVQAGVLQQDDVLDPAAGGRKLSGLTAARLQRAGLRRHHTAGL